MHTKLLVVLACGMALFLVACLSTPQSLIVGKWEVEGAPMKMVAEFHPDGTAFVTMLGQRLRGTYKLSGDNLEWTMNGTTTRMKVNVTVSELEVTNDQNQTIKYKRLG